MATALSRHPDFAAADADLRFRYGEASAVLGFRAQGYDVLGGAVFDDAASWRAHAARHQPRVRDAVDRLIRVDARLTQLERVHRATIEVHYTPRPWPAAVREAFRIGDATFASLAMTTLEAEALRARSAQPGVSLADFLAWECGQSAAARHVPPRLRANRDAAWGRLRRALAAYGAAS